MRLWHYRLLPHLPSKQLLGQHRECIALRGRGWGRRHSTVDYVFKHPYEYLYRYHVQVMEEMERRGYEPSTIWYDNAYRGRSLGHDYTDFTLIAPRLEPLLYPEHDLKYLEECLLNLHGKSKLLDISISDIV